MNLIMNVLFWQNMKQRDQPSTLFGKETGRKTLPRGRCTLNERSYFFFFEVFQKSFIFNLSRQNEDIWQVTNINICISIILFINFNELLFMVVSCAVGGYPASRILDKTERKA